VSWFCDFNQYDSLFKFWIYIIFIFKFLLIYLNDLKFETKKYHLFLQLIITNNNSISNDDDVAFYVSTNCYN
jgi:hypothetical protein